MTKPTSTPRINLSINDSDARAIASRTRAEEIKALWVNLREGLNRRRESRHQDQWRTADLYS